MYTSRSLRMQSHQLLSIHIKREGTLTGATGTGARRKGAAACMKHTHTQQYMSVNDTHIHADASDGHDVAKRIDQDKTNTL